MEMMEPPQEQETQEQEQQAPPQQEQEQDTQPVQEQQQQQQQQQEQQYQTQEQQQNFPPSSSGYEATATSAPPSNPMQFQQQQQQPLQQQPHPLQQQQQQQSQPLQQQYQTQQYQPQQQQQQQQQTMPYNQQQQTQQVNAYSLKAPPAMTFGASSAAVEERATHLLAACESCLVVTRIPGVDMSFRRIMERKCPRCGGTLVLPQEVMEMLILYGNFVPESVAVTLVLGTMVLHPSLRADFMAAAMNELLIPLQTDYVYDVAVPKRPEGLGMSLRMNQGNLVVGGFIDFENNSESPSVAARIIAVDDVLVAINKKSIKSWSFEKSISMLAHAASPVYLTFRRRQPVMLL